MRSCVSWKAVVVAATLALAAGCASLSSTAPSSTPPESSPGIVAAPTAVTLSSDSQLAGTAITVRWDSSAAGAAFVVHLGTGAGAADIGSFEAGTGRSYVHTNYQGRGRVFARVHARAGDMVSSLSSEASTDVYRLREAVEALFLANGRMSPAGNNGCGAADRMRGFNAGTQVNVLVGAGVPEERVTTIREFLDRVPGYTNGRLSGVVTRVAADVPVASQNQISVSVGDPTSVGCDVSVTGCFRAFVPTLSDGYSRAEIVVRAGGSANVYRHEFGHALIGLCHIDGNAVGGNTALMTPSAAADVSAVERTVMRTVFESSVRSGNDRSAFVAAGLVDAVPTITAVPTPGSGSDLVIVGP